MTKNPSQNETSNLLKNVEIKEQIVALLGYWLTNLNKVNLDKITEFCQQKEFIEDETLLAEVVSGLPDIYQHLPNEVQCNPDVIKFCLWNINKGDTREIQRSISRIPKDASKTSPNLAFEILEKFPDFIDSLPVSIKEDKTYIKFALENTLHFSNTSIFHANI